MCLRIGHCLLTESLDTTEYMNRQQRPDDALCIMHLLEDTFSVVVILLILLLVFDVYFFLFFALIYK